MPRASRVWSIFRYLARSVKCLDSREVRCVCLRLLALEGFAGTSQFRAFALFAVVVETSFASLRQICLDSLSDAKEMENLARRAERLVAKKDAGDGAGKATAPTKERYTRWDGGSGPPNPGRQSPGVRGASDNKRKAEAIAAAYQGHGMERGGGAKAGGRRRARYEAGESVAAEGEGEHKQEADEKGEDEGGEAEGEEGEPEEESWGVMLRNTIIRDLKGFGMEHAGPIGRSLISKVMSVSQDNYPEMVRI